MPEKDPIRCVIAKAPDAALDPHVAQAFVEDARFGGICVFTGTVRDANHGRDVIALEYDLFEPLALVQFERAAQQAIADCGSALKLYVGHARGRLQVGDVAVVVAAGSPHRDEAFRACRQVIEFVKHRAPIWKREHYTDGESAWSEGCSLCDAPHPTRDG